MRKSIKAWAIWLPYTKGYAGPYWFSREHPMSHQSGCRTALFRTRKAAEAAMKEASCPGRVVRVNATIEAVK